jgi:hypothetical protein
MTQSRLVDTGSLQTFTVLADGMLFAALDLP